MTRKIKVDKSILKVFLFVFLGLVRFIAVLPQLDQQIYPVIYYDEVAYLAHAAEIAGVDWYGLLSYKGSDWSSFGYSLVIAPLFYFFNNIHDVYKGVMIINGVLGIAVFGVLYLIGKKICKSRIGELWILLFAFLCSMYSGLITYSRSSLCEVLLCLFVLLNVYFFMLYEETGKLKWIILTTISAVYTYFIHNRMIVLLVALVIALVAQCVFHKGKRIHLLTMIGLMVMGFVVYALIKDGIYIELDMDVTMDSNSYGARTKSILRRVSDFSQYYVYLKSVLWKLWYVGVSSFTIGYWGIFFVMKKLWSYIIKCINKERNGIEFLFTYLVILITFGELVLVTALYGDSVGYTSAGMPKIDPLIYGRYVECIMPILLLLGIIQIWSERSIKVLIMFFLPTCSLFWYVGYRLYMYILSFPNYAIMAFQTVGIHIYRLIHFEDNIGFSLVKVSALSIVLGVIFIFVAWTSSDNYSRVLKIALILFMSFLMWRIGFTVVETPLITAQDSINEENMKVEELVKVLEENVEDTIYVYNSERTREWIVLQYNLWNRRINIVDSVEGIEGGLIVINKEDYKQSMCEDIVYGGYYYYILDLK